MNISIGGWPPALEYYTNMGFQNLEFNLVKLENSQNAQILRQTDFEVKHVFQKNLNEVFHNPGW